MARTCRVFPRIRVVLVVALATIAIATPAVAARTLYVANNGTDDGLCGAKEAPCRSISRAIANASPGDKLVVGPGRYGDLDGDTNFSDPGDETGPSQACSCLVLVDKPLTILSRDGAAATVIDAGGRPD